MILRVHHQVFCMGIKTARFPFPHVLCAVCKMSMSQWRKKQIARLGLKPRTSRTPCKHSDHWATEPHGRPVTISPCLIRFIPESARNHAGTDEKSFYCSQPEHGPTLATKCHRGGNSTWPDWDSNPRPLTYCASTLTTELPSHMVNLWHQTLWAQNP